MTSIREAYGQTLVRLAEKRDFFVMDADLAEATKTSLFRDAYPQRFIDMGIAEANMFCHAAGMAACGAAVFASTFSSFAAGRAYDQIRNSIAYPGNHVIIAATHNGVLVGPDGGSHQCIEDISLMCAIPGMTVICPSDPRETAAFVEAALDVEGPVYLRLGRSPVPDIFPETENFSIGKGNVVRDGSDAVIFSVGETTWRALEAADILKDSGIELAVISLASLKPVDHELIVRYAKRTGRVFTLEDHVLHGGLGSIVCQTLCRYFPCKVNMLGINDRFGMSGSPDELAREYGIDSQSVAEAVVKAVKNNCP